MWSSFALVAAVAGLLNGLRLAGGWPASRADLPVFLVAASLAVHTVAALFALGAALTLRRAPPRAGA